MVTPKWFRRRHYLHFDLPVGLDEATGTVTDPESVARHAFYPFIKTTITSIKLSRDKTTKRVERKLKLRDIACAAHLDSHVYAYYACLLSELYEAQIATSPIINCVLAFRTLGKSNVDFAFSAFSEILSRSSCDVVALDIKGFFDNLGHQLLKDAWCQLLDVKRLPPDHFNIFKSLTRWCWVEKIALYAELGISPHNPKRDNRRRICKSETFRENVRGKGLLCRNDSNKGIPQGSPISALLSNIYMLRFDEAMSMFAKKIGAAYFRYCDDMVVIAPAGTGAEVKSFAHEQIKRVELEIQDEKTEERSFRTVNGRLITDEPLQYLGFTFDGKNLRIRDSSMLRYFDRMKRGVAIAVKAKAKYNRIRLSEGRAEKPMNRKKLYDRYSYIGRRNFVSYGNRAANILTSGTVRKQIKKLWKSLRAQTDQ